MKNQHALDKGYKNLSAKFQIMSLREQFLILISGLVVLILLMYTLLFEPLFNYSNRLQQDLQSAQREVSTLESQVAQLTSVLETDPNDPIRQKNNDLIREILNITEQLEAQTNNLVPANEMAGMLESVLAGSTGLRLIELQSIAPEPIILQQAKKDEEPKAELYRHGVSLIFEGKYFDIQQYLKELESLPWKFYWKKFEYVVGDYPLANVELEIYTLSTNKAFIGV